MAYASDAIHAHLCSRAHRVLNDATKAGVPLPSENDLAAALSEYALPHVRRQWPMFSWRLDLGTGQRVPGRGYYREDLDRATSTAAAFCLQTFDPQYLHNRAVAGGRASKRRPEHTPDLLDGLQGLTRGQQAAALGCCVGEIDKLRRRARDRDLANEMRPPLPVPTWPAALADGVTLDNEGWEPAVCEHGGLFLVEKSDRTA